MPLKLWDTKDDFDSQYDFGAEGAWGVPPGRAEIHLHYHRHVIFNLVSKQRAQKLVEALGWGPTSLIVVIGCGFGWLIDALEELGVGNPAVGGHIIGADVSPYIQSAKSTNEDTDYAAAIQAVGLSTNTGDGLVIFNALRRNGEARSKRPQELLNEDGRTNASRGRIRTALKQGASNYDVLTEDLISSFTNAEVQQYSTALHNFSGVGRVIHLTGEYGPPYNTNTIAQWQALLPNDVIVSV